MEKKNYENIQQGKATGEDFPYTNIRNEELKTMYGKDENSKLLTDELEFNKDLQIYIINAMNKRKLTINYIVGTLFKLAWGLLQRDFEEQIMMIAKYEKKEK